MMKQFTIFFYQCIWANLQACVVFFLFICNHHKDNKICLHHSQTCLFKYADYFSPLSSLKQTTHCFINTKLSTTHTLNYTTQSEPCVKVTCFPWIHTHKEQCGVQSLAQRYFACTLRHMDHNINLDINRQRYSTEINRLPFLPPKLQPSSHLIVQFINQQFSF